MSLSKKIRFTIFERDGFKCQYCGHGVPDVILEVDHIIPKSKNGTDDNINLITSCFACNRGKSNKILNENIIPKIEKEQIDNLKSQYKEQQTQIKKYYKYLEKMLKSKKEDNPEIKIINETFIDEFGFTLNEKGKQSIKYFLKNLSIEEIIEGIYLLRINDFEPERKFRYFCGIMHNKIRNKSENA